MMHLILGLILSFIVFLIVYIWYIQHKYMSFVNKKDTISFKETMDLTGLPVITLNIDNNKLNFVLDTGSSTTVIDSNILENMKLSHDIISSSNLSGIEGKYEKVSKAVLYANYRGTEYSFPVLIKDMSIPFKNLKDKSGVTVAGLLGSDFFKYYKYVIDFNNLIAYSIKLNE